MGEPNEELTSPGSSEHNDGQNPAPLAEDSGQDSGESGAVSSPAATKDDEPFDLLSVVKDATKPKADAASSAENPEKGAKPSEDGTAGKNTTPTAAEPDNENFTDVPFHTHPRFKQLVAERNRYQQGAERYEQVETFLQQNGLTGDEAAEFLQLRALMKSDPAKAWEQLRPLAQDVLTRMGEVLPQDLQDRVRKGEITRDTALEMSRLRAQNSQTVAAQKHRDEQAERDRQAEAARAITSAVGTWESEMQSKDPTGFAALQEDLQREIVWRHRNGDRPTDPAGVRKQLDDAYAEVRKRRIGTASRPPKHPVTGGRGAGGAAPAQADSVLDIVRQRGVTN